MSYDNKLKPCPLCGSVDVGYADVEERGRQSGVIWVAGCASCGLRIERDSLDLAVAAWNRRASPWISVDERLPEEGDTVLLFWEDTKHIEDGVLHVFEGKIHHCLFDGESLNINPSHWMPLPELPED